jgi:predicted cupin superfamily sugar epimerase
MFPKPDPAELARRLHMAPHPEGGWYVETYRSPATLAPPALSPVFGDVRSCATSILYLLAEGRKSRWHRLRQDELWLFHLGGPLRLAMISPTGEAREIVLGPDTAAGQLFQFAVPAGFWFGAAPKPGACFSLAGCVVAPGFAFADLDMASEPELKKAFPALCGLISEFC